MKRLTKADILSASDLKTEDVEVPEWGGVITVATMSGTARDEFEASQLDENGKPKRNLAQFRARLAAATVVDEAGERLFSADDVEALGKKSAAALDRVFEVASKLNRLGPKDVEQLTKN